MKMSTTEDVQCSKIQVSLCLSLKAGSAFLKSQRSALKQLPLQPTKKPLLIASANQEIKYKCNKMPHKGNYNYS